MDSSPLMKEFVTGPAKALWIAQGLPPDTLDNLHLSITPDPAVNSSFKLGTAAQTSIGLSALAATHFHKLRTGEEQKVTVDARHAVIEFNSEKYYTIDGTLPKDQMWDELSDMYKTKDGYVRLHTKFSHHKQGILDILGCASTKCAVTAALLGWDAFEFEDEVRRRNLCAVALRTFGDTDRNAHSRTIINTQPVHIRKIGDAPPRPNPKGAEYKHALEGIRVLDLTRVLGGPVGGRTLAAHGADVLLVTSPHLPDLPFLDVETSRGKRTTQLDLNNEIDKSTLWNLVRDADVFLQSYRPGGLASRGFGPEEVAQKRPGIVYATLTAFGFEGELSGLKGFDSLMQAYSGMNAEEADAYREYVHATGGDTSALPPYRATPMQALDHAAGYLLAYGIITALSKTITVSHPLKTLSACDSDSASRRAAAGK
ncbi:hypothetical protein EWM64_g9027 [Hericium alpestre]|uniref:CoA-transferase family III domain-containing protein n=1 Tax=Hericium alpestre TaxID=135208 RepID=A0A4Y9ZK69_9AGAM|nr:hypothetical protein EWM64_g9027 [Hericium alpestre]